LQGCSKQTPEGLGRNPPCSTRADQQIDQLPTACCPKSAVRTATHQGSAAVLHVLGDPAKPKSTDSDSSGVDPGPVVRARGTAVSCCARIGKIPPTVAAKLQHPKRFVARVLEDRRQVQLLQRYVDLNNRDCCTGATALEVMACYSHLSGVIEAKVRCVEGSGSDARGRHYPSLIGEIAPSPYGAQPNDP